MSARRCTCRASARMLRRDESAAPGWSGWWTRSGWCWTQRYRRADQGSGTMPGQTANIAFSEKNRESQNREGRVEGKEVAWKFDYRGLVISQQQTLSNTLLLKND